MPITLNVIWEDSRTNDLVAQPVPDRQPYAGRPDDGRPVTLWAAVTITVLGGIAAVAVAARTSPVAGAAVGMGVAGVSALLSGVVIGLVSLRRHRAGFPGESPRAMLGVGVVMWGIGQVVLAFQTSRTGGRSFGAGDVCSTLAGPIVAAALLRLPRRSRLSHPGLMLGFDGVLLTSVTTLTLWWSVLYPAANASGARPSDTVAATVAVFFDLVVVSFSLLVWARESRPGVFALFLGCILQAVADIMSLPAVLGKELIPWQSGTVWAVAWPVIGLGMVQIRTARVTTDPDSVLEELGESRSTTITTVLSVAALVGVLAVPGPPRWSGIGGTLLAVVLTLLLVRELLGNRVRARLVKQLGTEALRDVLTGLPNRRALTRRIRALDLSRSWVLLTLDLDGFKEVNDLVGHQAGDELIVGVATVLAENSPRTGMVARIGGDEFAVLAPGDTGEGQRLAERLAAAIRTSPITRRDGITLSASIGIGRVLPEDPEDVHLPAGTRALAGNERSSDEHAFEHPGSLGGESRHQVPVLLDARHDRLVALVESAAALRAARASGRDRIAVYPGMVEQARQRRLVLEWRLRDALDEGRLQMHAQPLVDLRTGRVRGFESLARWNDDVLGPVSPAEFVPVAEQSGLVTALGDFALRATLESARDCGVFGRDIELGVNVSPIQLRLPNFAAQVADLVEELSLKPDQLLLEVTEAILVDEDDGAVNALAELADAGIKLAIDDFGTGYSALGYLRRLPVDVLKIDRSWVVATVTDRRTRNIVSGVVDLAHQLGAIVVMEGIEDDVVADTCRELGADQGQGWLFGRPKPWPEAVRELLGTDGEQPVAPAAAQE